MVWEASAGRCQVLPFSKERHRREYGPELYGRFIPCRCRPRDPQLPNPRSTLELQAVGQPGQKAGRGGPTCKVSKGREAMLSRRVGVSCPYAARGLSPYESSTTASAQAPSAARDWRWS